MPVIAWSRIIHVRYQRRRPAGSSHLGGRVRSSALGYENATSYPRPVGQIILYLRPYRERIIHVRWSGEACWIPLGDLDLGLGHENATSYPAPGQIILYPGGVSETEILLAYGSVQFASKVGVLAGNHFLTITEGLDRVAELGRHVLWHGAQEIVFEAAS